MIDSINEEYEPLNDSKFLVSKRIWDPITISEYNNLSLESQYASWVAVFGYIPNHFTVSVNHLHKYTTLQSVNNLLENHGFKLNESGGKIKGKVCSVLTFLLQMKRGIFLIRCPGGE